MTKYPPRSALNTNPINPIAEMSHIFGPLSAKIAIDEPTSNAEMIKDIDGWFFKFFKFQIWMAVKRMFSLKKVCLIFFDGLVFPGCELISVFVGFNIFHRD